MRVISHQVAEEKPDANRVFFRLEESLHQSYIVVKPLILKEKHIPHLWYFNTQKKQLINLKNQLFRLSFLKNQNSQNGQ